MLDLATIPWGILSLVGFASNNLRTKMIWNWIGIAGVVFQVSCLIAYFN